jgi:hypothetical protein
VGLGAWEERGQLSVGWRIELYAERVYAQGKQRKKKNKKKREEGR